MSYSTRAGIASERKLREAWACCTCSVAGRSLEPTCLSGSLGETLVLRRCPVGTDVGVPGWPNRPTMCSWNGNLDDSLGRYRRMRPACLATRWEPLGTFVVKLLSHYIDVL